VVVRPRSCFLHPLPDGASSGDCSDTAASSCHHSGVGVSGRIHWFVWCKDVKVHHDVYCVLGWLLGCCVPWGLFCVVGVLCP
jgi:hypothetical protein